jgi:hypothetical protein
MEVEWAQAFGDQVEAAGIIGRDGIPGDQGLGQGKDI